MKSTHRQVLALYIQASTVVGFSNHRLTQTTASRQVKPPQNPLPHKLLSVSKMRALFWSECSQNQVHMR